MIGCAPAPDAARTDDLTADLAALKARVETLETHTHADGSADRLDALEADVAAHDADLLALDDRVTSLETDAVAQATAVDAIDDRVAALETTAADQATVDALTDRVESIEAGNWRVGVTLTPVSGTVAKLPHVQQWTPVKMEATSVATFASDVGTSVANAKMTCSIGSSDDFSCAEGAPQLGIVFTVPSAGDYSVCVSFTDFLAPAPNGGDTAWYSLRETLVARDTVVTEGSVDVRHQEAIYGGNQVRGALPVRLCDVFAWTGGEKAVRLYYQYHAQRSFDYATIYNAPIRWDIHRLTYE